MSEEPRPTPTVVIIDGEPRSSCCRAELGITRELGSDTGVYAATELSPPEDGFPAQLKVKFVKTYDAVDGGEYVVECRGCLRHIEIEVEEM